jgi:parallel beta-helix repeat protein
LYDAIDLCSSGNTASNNTIYGADESGIHLDDSCTGASTSNTVSANTINSSCAGILSGPGASGTISGNFFYNTVIQQLTGVDTCTPPPANGPGKPAAKSRPRVRPAKP